METNRLRQFCVVYETGNLRKSAEILHLSHGALSKSLKLLQQEIRVELFQPEGRGLIPTDFAKEFYPRVLTFLEHQDELLKARKPKREIFRLGTFEVFSTHLLGSVWNKYFSNVELEAHELVPGHLENALLASKVDVGVTYEAIPTGGIEFIKLGQVQMGVYARVGAFVGTRTESLPFVAPIAPIEGTPTGVRGLDGWDDGKFQRDIKFRVGMLETGLAMARSGGAAIFLPRFVARLHNAIVLKEFHLTERQLPSKMKPVLRDVFLLRRKSTVENVLMRNLAKLVRNECCE